MNDFQLEPDHFTESQISRDEMSLKNGSRVGVIGGGPAGSFFSYFLLSLAKRLGIDLSVEIFEPRDFTSSGPKGCNMCAGIISESLVQMLAVEGILLPPRVVQRGISNYTLRTPCGSVSFNAPSKENRIATIYRGAGPLNDALSTDSFDGFLLDLAIQKGAMHTRKRVDGIFKDNDMCGVVIDDQKHRNYDLLVVATGINVKPLNISTGVNLEYVAPQPAKCHIREYKLDSDNARVSLGDSVQIFMLGIPGLEFAALIPKGDYVTLCMMGHAIDQETVNNFFCQSEVKKILDTDNVPEAVCRCSPSMHLSAAQNGFSDRLAFIGDAGASRIFKDGIGAAYRTAKGCATSALFHGVSEEAFAKHYWPICQDIERDNKVGKFVLKVNDEMNKRRFATKAMIRMIEREQSTPEAIKRMSSVMWDVFTGSATYTDILKRTLDPRFIARYLSDMIPRASDYH